MNHTEPSEEEVKQLANKTTVSVLSVTNPKPSPQRFPTMRRLRSGGKRTWR